MGIKTMIDDWIDCHDSTFMGHFWCLLLDQRLYGGG